MLSSTLLALERAHLEMLAAWCAASVLAGGALLVTLALTRGRAVLLRHFALQMLGWGVIELACVALRWRALAMRDYGGAVRLTTFVAAGVVAGAMVLGAGLTLALAGWRLTERLSLVGAGAAIALQGAVLLVLDLPVLHRLLAAG